MNNFVFYSPTEFVFGKNTEVQVGALARKYGAQKVMIVYGGGSVVRSGLLDRVKQSLQEAGVAYCEMGGVQPNPIDGKVYEGIQLCRREQVDMMLPVGGGSVIDTAKAIAAGALYDGDFWDFFIGNTTSRLISRKGVGQFRIHDGKYGTQMLGGTEPQLLECLCLGNYRHDGSHHGALLHEYTGCGNQRPAL